MLKSDPSVMHGEYKKFSSKGKLEILGYFKDGREDSTWSFYDSEGELEQVYDYQQYLGMQLAYIRLLPKNRI